MTVQQHSCNCSKHTRAHTQDWNNLLIYSYIIFILYFQKENLHAILELQDPSVKTQVN